MDKNDKLHNGIAPELNEEQLESVSGGWSGWDESLSKCPFCHKNLVKGNIDGVAYKICPNPQNHFKIKI